MRRGPSGQTVASGLLLALCLCSPWGAQAQSRLEKFRDPDDGAIDISGFLATSYGFLPLVTPITEPAIGFGVGGALAFMHRPDGWDIEEARADFEENRRMTSPSISAAYGMYASSNSWVAGVAHLGLWKNNRWRYLGAATAMQFNLSISGPDLSGQDRLFEYGLDGWALNQHLRYRIGDSDFWIGGLFDFLRATTVFTLDQLPDVDPLELDASLSSLGLAIRYDSRSNTFTPDRGVFADLTLRRLDDAIGSDFEYWAAKGALLGYIDPGDRWVLGLRAEAGTSGDDAPFWAQPSVKLRGIARNRYVGDQAGVFEGEVRFDFTRRWSVVGFGGAGWTVQEREVEEGTRWLGSGGAGFRYLLARAFGLRGGADLAYSSEGWGFYITMGSAWLGI